MKETEKGKTKQLAAAVNSAHRDEARREKSSSSVSVELALEMDVSIEDGGEEVLI